nr:ribonuclease H-like domain-containing protein [Tanacetum cinerariifolium]
MGKEGLEKPIYQTNVEEESDIEAISETVFGEQADDLNEVVDSAQQSIPKETSYDPFNIYDILNKKNKDVNAAATNSTGSESRPPMVNKENYVPWSSRLLRYAKSRPNGKLVHNSILNGPYVRKMIPEPCDANCDITVTETFHLQTDDELSDKELKQIEADDQAI